MNTIQTTTAVILAAGASSRFWPLNGVHKGLSPLMGKPLLWYTLSLLRDAGIQDAVIVQGIEKDIEVRLKDFPIVGLKVRYVVQENPGGTGAALRCALPILPERFLVLYGDDLYAKEDMIACKNVFPSLVALEVENPREFGVIVPAGTLVADIIEKPEVPPSSLANIGMYHVPKYIFEKQTGISSRGEEELTDYIRSLAQTSDLHFIQASFWKPMSYAWSYLDAMPFFMHHQGSLIHKTARVEEGCQITGPCYIGPGCQVGKGCIIEGPVSLEEGVTMGEGSIIRRSAVWKNSTIGKNCMLQDSVIGEGCVLQDNVLVESEKSHGLIVNISHKVAVVKRDRFGVALGAGTHIEEGATLGPALLVGPGGKVAPKARVYHNKEV
ncbi:MAG: sugar phosphate nucleotidyltransferase [bacterium]|nr:sugar phosphate nucleotidyltransferase [bacterium]